MAEIKEEEFSGLNAVVGFALGNPIACLGLLILVLLGVLL